MEKYIDKFGIFGLYLFALSLLISKAGINIGIVVMTLSSVFFIKKFEMKNLEKEQKFLLLALIGIVIIGIFSDGGLKSAEISLKKSYRYLPIFLGPIFLNTKQRIENFLLFFSGSVILSFIKGMSIYKERNWNFTAYRYESFTEINDGSHILAALSFLILGYIFYLYLKNKKEKILYFFIVYVLMIIPIILSQTRASWLALLAGIIIFAGMINLKKAVVFLGIMGVLVFPLSKTEFYKNNNYVKRFQSIKNIKSDSPKIRLILWESCINIYKENPITGVGRDNSPKYFLEDLEKNNKYEEVGNKDMLKQIAIAGNPHSMYFTALAEEGIGAFLLFYFWSYILLKEILVAFKLKKNNENMWCFFIIGCVCATCSSYVSGMTEDSWRTFWRANMYVFTYVVYLSSKKYLLKNKKLIES